VFTAQILGLGVLSLLDGTLGVSEVLLQFLRMVVVVGKSGVDPSRRRPSESPAGSGADTQA
jgi:hypothetical protein